MKRFVEEGNWGENISWRLYHSDDVLDSSLCTAVFCIAIDQDKIILMRSKRGWGMIGGHIETNETQLEALVRESQEEAGFTPHNPIQFGYREITPKVLINKPGNRTNYPYPVSYIVYYWAVSKSEVRSPYGNEVLDSRGFSIEEIRKMNISDLSTIELGWKSYLKH